MSEPEKDEEEPSMEEILASIRRIISEDDEEAKPEEAEASETEAAPEPEPEPEPAVEEEVLELTEEDLEDASQDDIDNMFDSVVDDAEEDELVLESEPEDVEEAEPEPEINEEEIEEIVADDLGIDDVDPAEGDDVIVSDAVSSEIQGQFDALSALLTTGYQGSGNTLEDLVRELLRPMLKHWLEENLPPLAERMVAKEIARLARTKKP